VLYVALLLLWIVFSIPAGLVLGRGIHVADVLRSARVRRTTGICVFRSASADAPTFNDRQLAAKLRQRDRLTPRKTI
jgi:hypothetical protein